MSLLANPHFHDSDLFRKDDDVRWHEAAVEKEQEREGAARARLGEEWPA